MSEDASEVLRERTFVWILFFTVGHIQHVLQANQFTIWVLFLCTLGLTLLFHRKPFRGGFILGLAGCIKVTPFVFLFYLALRRQWRGLMGMILAVLIVDVLPSVAFFGTQCAIREHQAWMQRADWYSNWRHIEDPLLRVRHHLGNCSYSVVLGRLFSMPKEARIQVNVRGDVPPQFLAQARSSLQPGEHLTIDPMPPPGSTWRVDREPISDEVPSFTIAHLPPIAVWIFWFVTVSAAFAALAFHTFRRSGAPPASLDEETAIAALWMLFMLLPTPMMRDYYLALALPAYVVVWRTVDRTTPVSRGRAGAIASLAFFYLGVIFIWSHYANWFGLHLATLAVLAAATVWASRVCRAVRGERSPYNRPS